MKISKTEKRCFWSQYHPYFLTQNQSLNVIIIIWFHNSEALSVSPVADINKILIFLLYLKIVSRVFLLLSMFR